jgi:L-aminopeptidase/D-esterase-like protein
VSERVDDLKVKVVAALDACRPQDEARHHPRENGEDEQAENVPPSDARSGAWLRHISGHVRLGAGQYNRHLVTPFLRLGALAAALAAAAGFGRQAPANAPSDDSGRITAIPGIRVGHAAMTGRPTGCTVVLAPEHTVGAVDVRGGAPGTRETNVLAPDNSVAIVNAIVLAGGSAFGLDAAGGVMKYLDEQHIGYAVGPSVVPIVPAAILFDLNVGGHPEIRPDASCGYRAASSAAAGVVAEGSVGAGLGATVGKLAGAGRAMKGGVGTASIRGASGVLVGALVAVNAVGTVIDPRTGRPIAGVRTPDGKSLADPFALIRDLGGSGGGAAANTTIGVVATTARLTKAEALRVAEMAQDGLARAIVPSHTPSDGDTLFVLATGTDSAPPNVSVVGALAAEAVSDAIVRAVRLAHGLPGFPAASDIK